MNSYSNLRRTHTSNALMPERCTNNPSKCSVLHVQLSNSLHRTNSFYLVQLHACYLAFLFGFIWIFYSNLSKVKLSDPNVYAIFEPMPKTFGNRSTVQTRGREEGGSIPLNPCRVCWRDTTAWVYYNRVPQLYLIQLTDLYPSHKYRKFRFKRGMCVAVLYVAHMTWHK